MVGFFERLFGKADQEEKSGKMAKDRLQFVLVQDRINLPAEKMQAMQKEIIEVISKYVAVDTDRVDFALSNRERNGLLIAEIPFKKAVDSSPEIAKADVAGAETADSEENEKSDKEPDTPEVKVSISSTAATTANSKAGAVEEAKSDKPDAAADNDSEDDDSDGDSQTATD